MSTLAHVTNEQFEKEVLQSAEPVLVDFYATWCPPCKQLAPILEGLAGEYAGRVKIVKVNVDEQPELAGRFQISGVPTMILFKDQAIADVMVGLTPRAALRAKLDAVAPAGTAPAAPAAR